MTPGLPSAWSYNEITPRTAAATAHHCTAVRFDSLKSDATYCVTQTVARQWDGQGGQSICFTIKYTEEILSNGTRKLLWFEITKMPIAVSEKNYYIIRLTSVPCVGHNVKLRAKRVSFGIRAAASVAMVTSENCASHDYA